MFKTYVLGKTSLGFSIEGLGSQNSQKRILLMSGLHGDEVEGVVLTALLTKKLAEAENEDLLKSIFILQVANPDGFNLAQRCNARNVDLNRNWPTKNWTPIFTNPRYPPGDHAASEVETKALQQFIENNQFEMVVDLHSYKESVILPLLAHADESLRLDLTKLGDSVSLPVMYEQEELGYSIAGGFHTWCFEMGIHNITVEIEKGLGQFEINEKFLSPLLTFLQSYISRK